MNKLQAAYQEYCEAKADIGEEPFDFETWFKIEKSLNSPISKWDLFLSGNNQYGHSLIKTRS